MFDDFAPGMHSYADQATAEPTRERHATEVGRILARYIADTTSFDRGNARVKAGLASTGAQARKSKADWAQYGKYGVLAVGAAVVGSAKSFANFDRNMNIFGANIEDKGKRAAESMRLARNEAVRLGQDSRFPAVTAAHVAETLVELTKAGLGSREAIGSLESVMLLGTAGQMEFADAGNIAANAMNAFGKTSKDLPSIVDAIAGAALRSSSDVTDVAEAFRYTSSAAATLGVPIEQVTSMIGLLSNVGLKGDMAGTSMRMFFTSLTGRSKKAITLMGKLGIMNKGKSIFFNKDGELKNLAEVARLWKKHTRKLTQEQRIKAAHTIFGVRGMNVERVLNKGGAAFKKFQARSTEVGSANKLAVANTKGLYGAYQNLVNVVQTLGLQLGEALAPTIVKILNHLTRLFSIISKNERLIKAIARAILIGAGAWALWRASLIAVTIITNLYRLSLLALRVALVFLRNPILFARMAIQGLGAAMLANPIGLVIGAIIAIILILRHFGVGLDDVKRVMKRTWDFMKRAWAGIKSAVAGAVDGVLAFLKSNWPYIVGLLGGPLGVAIAAIYKNWGRIKTFFSNLKTTIVNAMKSAMSSAIKAISGAASGAWSAAKNLGARIISGIISGVKSMPGKLADAVLGMIPGGKQGKKIVGAVLGKLPGRAGGGPISAGRPYIVGERGPEIFMSRSSGSIVPNHAIGGGGASVIVENMNVRSEEDAYVVASILGRKMALGL